MTAVELNQLLTRHYGEIETLHQARNSDLNKQHDAMLKKLQRRLKNRPKENGKSEEDEEMKELLQEVERASSRHGMSCGSDSSHSQKVTLCELLYACVSMIYSMLFVT